MQAISYIPEKLHLEIRIKADKAYHDEILMHAFNTIAPTHKEEGCLEYRLLYDTKHIVLKGIWKNQMLMDMHLLLKHHLDLVEVYLPRVSKKIKILQYKEIEPPITALSLK